MRRFRQKDSMPRQSFAICETVRGRVISSSFVRCAS
jgi:hypothetical protein